MDDSERLGLINKLAERIDDCESGVKSCSQQAFYLSKQRARTQTDLTFLKTLYGSN